MADRVSNHRERAPRARLRSDLAAAEFFPGEVARLLGLEGVDYAQLRDLHRIGRRARGLATPGRKWARYTLADLAAVEVLVTLGGGRDALSKGRRLVLGDIVRTCDALRGLGFDNPLLQVPMARDGRRILARVNGFVLEPTTGQLVLESAWHQVDAFLEARLITNRQVRKAIRTERHSMRLPRRRVLQASDELGTLDGVVSG